MKHQDLFALIVSQEQWRDDNRLLAMFVWWAHAEFGLTWQNVLLSSDNQYLMGLQSVRMYIVNTGIQRVEIVADGNNTIIQAESLNPRVLAQLVWYLPKAEVVGLVDTEGSFKSAFSDWPEGYLMDDCSVLYQKLVTEFKQSRAQKPRISRLYSKLITDPVLFFKDSNALSGKLIYKLMCMFQLERSL